MHTATPQRTTTLEGELREVLLDICRKLPLNFRHVRDAFRSLDLGHDGRITRSEMRSFLRGFGWPEDVADRIFGLLDEDGHGYVDYSEFMSHFEPVLGSGGRPAARMPAVAVSDQRLDREVNEMAAVLRERFLTKFKTAREALRTLDLSGDGRVMRSELRRFFRTLSLPHEAADKVFRMLAAKVEEKTGEGTTSEPSFLLEDFVALFRFADKDMPAWTSPTAPAAGGRLQAVDGLRDPPRWARLGCGSCPWADVRLSAELS